MSKSSKFVTMIMVIALLLVATTTVFAGGPPTNTHQVVNEFISWELPVDFCPDAPNGLTGTGDRHQVINTRTNADGTVTVTTNDLVRGDAADINGNGTYHYVYTNHSVDVLPAGSDTHQVTVVDSFVLNGPGSVGHMNVGFNWSWTYTSEFWPPIDNWVQNQRARRPAALRSHLESGWSPARRPQRGIAVRSSGWFFTNGLARSFEGGVIMSNRRTISHLLVVTAMAALLLLASTAFRPGSRQLSGRQPTGSHNWRRCCWMPALPGAVESTLESRLGHRVDNQLADLGRLLWFDTLTGLNDDNTCGGCHSPTNGFGDTQSIAIGIENNGVVGPDRSGPRNMRRTPMIINSAFYPRLMWNSRFLSLSGDPFDNSAGLQFPDAGGSQRFPTSHICSRRRRSFHRPSARRWPVSRFPATTTRSGLRCSTG